MKKFIAVLLTLILVIGINSVTSANRAAQFVDVPLNHWSYDLVNKLAQKGLADKLPNDKMISRYEMGVITAKAIAKEEMADAEGMALIEQLSQEYSAELRNLGIALDRSMEISGNTQQKVDTLEKKVNTLEKKQNRMGNIALGADARVAWLNYTSDSKRDPFRMRFRLNLGSEINENTSFYGRVVLNNQSEMGTFYSDADRSNGNPKDALWEGLDRVYVADVAFTRKNFMNKGTNLTFGRFTQQMDVVGGYWMFTNGGVDGIKISGGDKLKVEAGFANFGPAYAQFSGGRIDNSRDYQTNTGTPGAAMPEIKDAFFLKASYPATKELTLGGWWLKEKTGDDSRWDVRSVNFSYKINPKLVFAGDYGQNAVRSYNTYYKQPTFAHYRLTYGPGEKYNVPGSWSLAGEYYRFEQGSNSINYTANMVNLNTNIKGWAFLARRTLEKNLIGSMFYSFNGERIIRGSTKGIPNPKNYHNYFRMQVDYLM